MRAFQFINLLLFLAFYVFLSISSIYSISKISGTKYKTLVRSIISLFSILLILFFIFLYVWPNNARSTGEYSWYLIYNAVLSIDFIFKIPLAFSYIAAIVFFRRKQPTIYFMGFIISTCLSGSVIYGTLFGKNELVVNRIELKFHHLPKNFDGYELVQISDIHLGSFIHSKQLMENVSKEINHINPALILFTGDLVNNFSNEINGWAEIFKTINDGRISYSILGNHDYGNYSQWDSEKLKEENFEKVVLAHQQFGFNLLRNQHTRLVIGNDSIYIIGVENWGHPPFPQYAELEKAMRNIPKNSFKILLTHDPAHWESVVKERQDIDLSLSGHTHGLQWGIKKAGILFSPSYFIRKNWAGFYQSGNAQLYVNTGLGTVGIPWRINMPGEITVIKLKRVEID